MKKWNVFVVLAALLFAGTLFAQQYKVSGKVTSSATGESLIGANVYVKGSYIGAPSDQDGKFSFTVDKGTYTIVCSYIGFKTEEVTLDVVQNVEVNFELEETEFSLSVEVLADRAKERETPVAFTNVDKEQMEMVLGSQDIPMALNITPSVYSTMQGGGAGDARINVRGFDQRNVAIMINGVPVNDMENGWVYWSNWDGVGDATSSIQIQRGLSAVNLATPSIGGTMNIITDPTSQKMGFKLKQEFGSGTFLKTTASASTGLVDNKWALSATIVRKVGNGLIDKTWTDAWAYYVGYSYNIDKKNRIEFYVLGAPQRHGQNLYKQNIATYSHDLAKDLDYSADALAKFAEQGRFFNQNWSPVNSSYNGQQAWNTRMLTSSATHFSERYASDFINERENFFHKPIVNLNWYSQLADNLSLYSTLYWSGGDGGGTGTIGSLYRRDANGKLGDDSYKFYYGPSPWQWDWNKTIEVNSAPAGTYYVDKKAIHKGNGEAIGVLRNSRNNQWTWGLISKLYWKVSDNLKTSFGIDWRTAEIDHYREVRDLLGGTYFYRTDSEFWTEGQRFRRLGDKIDYYNTNTVDWFGGYAQAEFSAGKFTAYGTAGLSTIKYTFLDHFAKGPDGNELFTEADWINGYQFKGGADFRLSTNLDVFANAGYVSKVPIFDNVINDYDGTKAADPKNEKFTHIEAGVNFHGLGGRLNVKANYYYTLWTDRAKRVGVTNQDGSEGLIFLQGMDQLHTGLEVEAAFQPIKLVRVDAAVSLGNWNYTDDVSGKYNDYSGGGAAQITPYNFYIKDLKVGDQPQTAIVGSASFFPIRGLTFSAIYRYYANHYANFDPFSRTDKTDREQSWLTPTYGVLDLHFAYNLPIKLAGMGIQVFGHMFNTLDDIYIQDAVDNSKYNAFTSDGKNHKADDAEVFLGLPRTFNLGVSIRY